MSFWTKKAPNTPDAPTAPVARAGKELPGIAGYQGIVRLPKNAMPLSRFNYVRPDGKPQP
jgi:hypothetical protein